MDRRDPVAFSTELTQVVGMTDLGRVREVYNRLDPRLLEAEILGQELPDMEPGTIPFRPYGQLRENISDLSFIAQLGTYLNRPDLRWSRLQKAFSESLSRELPNPVSEVSG